MDKPIKKPHSIIGITSFCIAIISLSIFIITTIQDVTTMLLATSTYINNSFFPNYITIVGMFINPIGTGLGIAAILEKGKKKVFAISGFIINAIITVFGIIMIL